MADSRRKATLIVVVILVGVGILFVFGNQWRANLFSNDSEHSDAETSTHADTSSANDNWNESNSDHEENSSESQTEDTGTSGYSDWEAAVLQDYREATDLRIFADSIMTMAIGGDSSAQFYLAMTLAECNKFALFYLRQDYDSIDDWMIYHNKDDDRIKQSARKKFDRCKGFLSKDEADYEAYFGERDAERSWLAQAAALGHPAAQIMEASRLETSRDSNDHLIANRYIEQATLSKHPEALYQIAMRYSGYGSVDRDPVRYVAWSLLTCEYGKDCSAESEWASYFCETPPGCVRDEDVRQLLTAHESPYVYEEAQKLAVTLRAALEAQDLERLDLPIR